MPIDLTVIRARAEAATPGPWRVAATGLLRLVGQNEGDKYAVAEIMRHPEEAQTHANATFIAHARTDVPILLAEVARLAEEVERLRGRVEKAYRFDMGERVFISHMPDGTWQVVDMYGPDLRTLCLDGRWDGIAAEETCAAWQRRSRFPSLDAAWTALDAARRGEAGQGGGE